MKTSTAAVIVLTILAATSTHAQTMYKCVQGGKTVYQAEACPSTANQHTLKPRDVPAPAAVAAGDEVSRMVDFMSTYRACADGIQIWGKEMAGPYAEWRTRNTAMLSRIEKDTKLQANFQEQVNAKRNGKAGMCRDVALELRGQKPAEKSK